MLARTIVTVIVKNKYQEVENLCPILESVIYFEEGI